MRIAIVTDAWRPQVNGVVTTLSTTAEELKGMGHEVLVINPSLFRTFPLPTYPEIQLAIAPGGKIARLLREFAPDHIHIATEGTLGWAAHRFCRKHGWAFSTSYHTQFPEYVRKRFPVPVSWTYAILRRFHARAGRTMVATRSMRQQLADRGFSNLAMWERGVDTRQFKPADNRPDRTRRDPVWVYVGRVAVEKNIEAFLALDLPGTKRVIGHGPSFDELSKAYPDVDFLGYKFGAELAAAIAEGDVFVFPSLTDTFGLVMLEAMACGLPVAAFPVTGPIDVVEQGVTGILDEDLRRAALQALELDGQVCRQAALKRTWANATGQFLNNLVPVEAQVGISAAAEV